MVSRSWIAACALLALFGSEQALADTPTKKQEARFMDVCLHTHKGKPHVCRCFYKGNAAVLNRQQMELMIAFVAKDVQRQEQIKGDPNFDYDAYTALGKKALAQSAACLVAQPR